MSDFSTRAVEDGIVSRHLNRRVSRPLARVLARTRVSPNQITALSFVAGLLSAGAFASGANIAGGLLAQAASILDGVDGDLARLRSSTARFGAFLDAVLDRYADASIIVGMALGAATHDSYLIAWGMGIAALVGSLVVSYTRARAEVYTGLRFQGILSLCATRDARLFLIFAGGLLDQLFWTLVLLAVITNASVAWRVWLASKRLRSDAEPF